MFISRNEIKVLQEHKKKAYRKPCRVRDEQKTIGKIKVNTELYPLKQQVYVINIK